MDYLILDTNIYIDLCLKRKRKEVLTKSYVKNLKDLLESNNLKIAVPEIVKTEFNRNIKTQFDNSNNFIREIKNNIDEIALPQSITDEHLDKIKQDFIDILAKFKNIDIESEIKPVLDIMNHNNNVTLQTTDGLIIKTFKRVVEKKAPAHKDKNESKADCLIIESIIDFFQNNEDANKAIFVTHDKKGFSDPDDNDALHPDLKPVFEELGIAYSTLLSKTLKDDFNQQINEDEITVEKEISEEPKGPIYVFQDKYFPVGEPGPYRYGIGEECDSAVIIAPSTGLRREPYKKPFGFFTDGEGSY